MPLLQAELRQLRLRSQRGPGCTRGGHAHKSVPTTRKSTPSSHPTRGRLYLCLGGRGGHLSKVLPPLFKCSRRPGCVFCSVPSAITQPRTLLTVASNVAESLTFESEALRSSGCLDGTEGRSSHRHALREGSGLTKRQVGMQIQVPKELNQRGWLVS